MSFMIVTLPVALLNIRLLDQTIVELERAWERDP